MRFRASTLGPNPGLLVPKACNGPSTGRDRAVQSSEVKPHFINPCCFGEDFAAWLRGELGVLAPAGFDVGDPIQEDYGWGLWVRQGKHSYWIAISFCGDGPSDDPGRWVVSIADDPGLNLLKRLFQRPDAASLTAVKDAIWRALERNAAIRVVEDPR